MDFYSQLEIFVRTVKNHFEASFLPQFEIFTKTVMKSLTRRLTSKFVCVKFASSMFASITHK